MLNLQSISNFIVIKLSNEKFGTLIMFPAYATEWGNQYDQWSAIKLQLHRIAMRILQYEIVHDSLKRWNDIRYWFIANIQIFLKCCLQVLLFLFSRIQRNSYIIYFLYFPIEYYYFNLNFSISLMLVWCISQYIVIEILITVCKVKDILRLIMFME